MCKYFFEIMVTKLNAIEEKQEHITNLVDHLKNVLAEERRNLKNFCTAST